MFSSILLLSFFAVAKDMSTAILLHCHTWLRSTDLEEPTKKLIKDLPLDGTGLFVEEMDKSLNELQQTRMTAKLFSLVSPAYASTRPKYQLFYRRQHGQYFSQPPHWQQFDNQSQHFYHLKHQHNEIVKKHLPSEAIANITAGFNSILMESQSRDNYRELLQLVLVFVGAVNGTEVGFKSPGAISHARWMVKAIYCLKIFLFHGQFKLSDEEHSALEAVCIFLVRVYCKAWFNAHKARLAPKQDFDLFRCLLDYQEIDKDISERALVKFSNHLWYFKAELVALVFFDPSISDEEKSEMAKKVLLTQTETETENSRIVNPKFRRHQLEELVNAGLSGLITKGTMNFFERFQINVDFLREPPSSWPENIHFNEGLGIVKSLKVVNDVAERGVKLITDFNNLLTKDEEQKQYGLQVIHKSESCILMFQKTL